MTTREGALLETEGWGSKTLSVKENLHSIVAGIFQVYKLCKLNLGFIKFTIEMREIKAITVKDRQKGLIVKNTTSKK